MSDKNKNYKDAIFISGVGKGIGKSLLEYFVEKNIFVFGITRTKKDVIKFKNIKNCEVLLGDVRDTSQIKKIFDSSLKKNFHIKGIVNNAGIRQRSKIQKITRKQIQDIFDINFFSVFEIMKIFLNYSIKNKIKTSIVNIGSIVGGTGFDELCGYASTKGALKSLTQSFAVENAKHNVRANIINPGFVQTSYFDNFKKNNELYKWTISRIPLKRWARTDEICGAVNFLISDESSYVTGETINIDGGWINS